MTQSKTSKAVSAVAGAVVPFDEYLEQVRRPKMDPVVWSWTSLLETLARASHGERGTLALVSPGGAPATIAQGLSAAIQTVRPQERTSPHSHSFWHLFIVQEGSGEVGFDDSSSLRKLGRGDIVLVPAWQAHWFRAHEEQLVMLALQNLPQIAEAGSFMIEKEDGSLGVLYRDG